MGKSKRRRPKFQYDRNRRKEWKKSLKLPAIQCPQIKEAWDQQRSVKFNLRSMGLAVDPNQSIPVPQSKILEDLEVAPVSKPKQKVTKPFVASALEVEASVPEKRTLKLSEPDVEFCTYMMEKYGEDHKAMARDRKNYYQETPKRIRAMINSFKSTPTQYQAYLDSKKDKMDSEGT